MEGESEKACVNCGAPVKEGASFCTKCGAAQPAPEGAAAPPTPPEGAPAAGAAAPPPPPQAAGEGVPGAPMPVAPAAAKKSKAPMIIGIVGSLLILGAVAVLVLWLTVWSGGGSSGADDPIALAEKYIAALEDGNLDAYKDCFPADFFNMEDVPMMEEMGFDIDELLEMTFDISEFRFDGVALELESETKGSAIVVTTSGTVSVSTMGFEEEIDLEDDPLEFEMEKMDGKWYLVDDPMAMIMGGGMDLDMDLENLEDIVPEDLNLEDLEDLLPEDLNLEDFENLLPEDLNLEDLDVEELEQLLRDLEEMMEDMPQGEDVSA